MIRKRPTLGGCLLLALLIGSAGSLHAEVTCENLDDFDAIECLFLLIAGITEEPDPLTMPDGPQAVGEGVIPSEGVTVPVPQVATGGGLTVAVWEEIDDGEAGDIMFAEWRPGGWQNLALTIGSIDERDPQVDVADDGTVYVTWWEVEVPRQIRVARRDPVTQQWSFPVEFSQLFGGSRPTVLAVGSEVLVAYERRVWSGGQEVVVQGAGSGHSLAEPVVLARTYREAPLAIELHPHGTRPYIDWIHQDGYFGYSEYVNGQWGASLSTRPLTQRANSGRRDILPALN